MRLLDPSGFQNPKGLLIRLITLTGAGGCGKTRLALQVGAALCQGGFSRGGSGTRPYADGVWFVALAALSDPALVSQQIANLFEVREQAGQSLLATLSYALRDKHLLLILDNCEHLIEACAQVAQTLLQACPHLAILATSREALNIAGEQIYLVPSLETPVSNFQIPHSKNLTELSQNESVQLFVERARAAQAHFALTEQNANAIAHICKQLDGIPLAIELAAARVKAIAVEEIATRLGKGLGLLTGGRRTALPRQQTMRATLDWSHDLLTESEQALFRRLAVFAGGWTLAAAEFVCLDGYNVLDTQSLLVDKSLVLAEARDDDTRYRMLEPVRQYAEEKLLESGESASMSSKHLNFFLQWAELAAQQFQGLEQPTWANRLKTELDNIRAALHGARAGGQMDVGVQLAVVLMYYWSTGGYQREARDWFESFLTHPEVIQRTPTRAKALIGAGWLAGELGDATLGNLRLVESVALWRESKDKRWLAFALRILGFNLLDQLNDWLAAQPILEESAALSREIEDKWGLAIVLRYLGRQPDLDYAEPCLEESLTLFRELEGPWGIGAALMGLGVVNLTRGHYAKAKACLEEALALRRSAHDRLYSLGLLNLLGDIAMFQDNLAEARQCFAESIAGRHAIAAAWTPTLLHRLGQIALLEGDYAKAKQLCAESLVANRKINHFASIAACLSALAAIAMAQGQPLEAVRLFGAVEALLENAQRPMLPYDHEQYAKHTSVARTQLSASVFTKTWNEGRALTLDQAITLAQQIPPSKLQTPTPNAQLPTPTGTGTAPANPADLTEREVEVLRWLARGLSDAEIAAQLSVSVRTVNSHLRSIYSKLDVTSRTAAARVAIDLKLA